MNHQRTPHEIVTLVDDDGNIWARLNCRGCLLNDRKELRFPVWVLKGSGSGLCRRCGEPREEPMGVSRCNPNLSRGVIHREQYEGTSRWYGDEDD
jgi:hypothetical protein